LSNEALIECATRRVTTRGTSFAGAASDNTLLLRLVRPDDELNIEYWNMVVDDLLVLEAHGGFGAFRAKFRERDGPSLDPGCPQETEIIVR